MTKVKEKNTYIHSLTDEFKQINDDKIKKVDIDLTKIKIDQFVKLVKQNINNKKLAIDLGNNKIYMLNETQHKN